MRRRQGLAAPPIERQFDDDRRTRRAHVTPVVHVRVHDVEVFAQGKDDVVDAREVQVEIVHLDGDAAEALGVPHDVRKDAVLGALDVHLQKDALAAHEPREQPFHVDAARGVADPLLEVPTTTAKEALVAQRQQRIADRAPQELLCAEAGNAPHRHGVVVDMHVDVVSGDERLLERPVKGEAQTQQRVALEDGASTDDVAAIVVAPEPHEVVTPTRTPTLRQACLSLNQS